MVREVNESALDTLRRLLAVMGVPTLSAWRLSCCVAVHKCVLLHVCMRSSAYLRLSQSVIAYADWRGGWRKRRPKCAADFERSGREVSQSGTVHEPSNRLPQKFGFTSEIWAGIPESVKREASRGCYELQARWIHC